MTTTELSRILASNILPIKIEKEDFSASEKICQHTLEGQPPSTLLQIGIITEEILNSFRNEYPLAKSEIDLLLFLNLIFLEKAFQKAPLFQRIGLALLIQKTPKIPEYYKFIEEASWHIALGMIKIKKHETNEEKAARKAWASKNGGIKAGQKRKLISRMKQAEIILWIKEDLKINPERHLASRIEKKFKLCERTARKMIGAYKNEK